MQPDSHQVSKRLSWLLRHGAPKVGIELDPAGWTDIDAVLEWLGGDRAALDAAVANNNKQRLQVEGGRVRCCQGHSRGVGVVREALEASWTLWSGEHQLWHGTEPSALAGIASNGIDAQTRTHVHLAAELHSTVGKRANVAVMLAIEPTRLRDAGFEVFEAPNGVLLTRAVPPGCIVDLRPMTHAARRDEAALRAFFGWDD